MRNSKFLGCFKPLNLGMVYYMIQVTLSKLLNLLVPHFPICKMGELVKLLRGIFLRIR